MIQKALLQKWWKIRWWRLEVLASINLRRNCPLWGSGGAKQRLAVAQAIIIWAEVLIADEPTGALDSLNRPQPPYYLWSDQRAGQTILYWHSAWKSSSRAKRVLFHQGWHYLLNPKSTSGEKAMPSNVPRNLWHLNCCGRRWTSMFRLTNKSLAISSLIKATQTLLPFCFCVIWQSRCYLFTP